MSKDDEDALLVAYIDGELDGDARAAIEARLTGDADLRERLMRLQEGDRPFVPAFAALLDEAPIERLQASLAAHIQSLEPRPTPIREFMPLRSGRLGIAAAVILFCVGIVIGHYGPSWRAHSPETAASTGDQDEDWRQAVVEYTSLYTADTFGPEPASQVKELAALGAKIGLTLTPERVALAGLQFRGAQILGFRGAPLGQLGYLDPTTGPVVFCIIRDSEPDAAMKAETRGEFAVASWARAGHGYMLIGRLPVNQMAGLADSLERRF